MLKQLLLSYGHCEETVAYLLQKLHIKFTRSYLQKELTEHPDYPSLTSIADVIGISYDVSCAAIRIDRKALLDQQDINPPFIAFIKNTATRQDVFAVITKFSNDAIEMYDPVKRKIETLSSDEFEIVYKGIVLLVESGDKKEEHGYGKHVKQEKQKNLLQSFGLLSVPVITLLTCLAFLFIKPFFSASIYAILFTLITLAGCIVGAILLWHEIDEYNPVVKQICQTTAKVNCSAILNSTASKIGGLSWATVGFVYFMSMLLLLIITLISPPALTIASWLNLGAIPYTIFSIYYQWKVAKQWCMLCLIVQGLLLLQFIVALVGGFHHFGNAETLTTSLIGIISAIAFVFTGVLVLMPALQKAKDNKQKTIELQRMKHNPLIFEGVLSKQKRMEKPADGLGILLGNPRATYRLIKVCNPYCGPCAKAHPVMEELAANNDDLSLQIIFTASNDEKDTKKKPVAHLLAIAAQNNPKNTRDALDDWYTAPRKDYETFATKYPLNGELKQQEEKIEFMRQWCDEVQIRFTPTFFICTNTNNNEKGEPEFYQLPEMYTLNDLKYFLSS